MVGWIPKLIIVYDNEDDDDGNVKDEEKVRKAFRSEPI